MAQMPATRLARSSMSAPGTALPRIVGADDIEDMCHIPPVDNSAADVDAEASRGFFITQAVDGIGAGQIGCGCQSFGEIPRGIPSLRTWLPACLHKLSTGLCTARLDESQR